MKKIATLITLLILALIPIGVLAGPASPIGVIVKHPNDVVNCSPTDVVTVENVPTGYHVTYSIKFDGNDQPVGTGDLTGSSVSIPIPYPDSSTWTNHQITVLVATDIIQDGTQKVEELNNATWVVTCEPLPLIKTTKTADPVEVTAPGGTVAFTVVVENKSSPGVAVTLTSLIDDIYGNILNLTNEGGTAKPEISTTCTLPQIIQPGNSYTCSFSAMVSGDVGYTETDTVSAYANDDAGHRVCDDDDATVTVVEPPPAIDVTKTADPVEVNAPGGPVTFTVVVENQSSPTDPVTITSLTDDIYGNLLDLTDEGGTAKPETSTTCTLPQLILPGGIYTCTFSATVSGDVGHTETDTVTASGTDNEGTPVSDFDDATVTVIAQLRYHLYFPLISNEPPGFCRGAGSFGVTIGFEDLPVTGNIDYDYNDWITDIQGEFTCDPTPDLIRRMDLTFTPQARGAEFNHAFHFRIPPNTFAGNGTATLNIYDQGHNLLSSSPMAFVGSADTDITVFPMTSDVFPPMTNTTEGVPPIPPARTATLSIEFDTPVPFTYSPDSLNLPHGEELFFDPYLHVIDWNGDIHTGDFRLLSVPVATYLWPEERVRIFNVYQGITFMPGPPPTLDFVPFWWELPHNECVYGDGVVCHLLLP